jgi:hypothetical protein
VFDAHRTATIGTTRTWFESPIHSVKIQKLEGVVAKRYASGREKSNIRSQRRRGGSSSGFGSTPTMGAAPIPN